MNNYLYVWIHSMKEHQNEPQYPVINVEKTLNKFEFRGRTDHHIKCFIQDIPENGADFLHFKYIHTDIIRNVKSLQFLWKPKWKRGDDPDLKEMF